MSEIHKIRASTLAFSIEGNPVKVVVALLCIGLLMGWGCRSEPESEAQLMFGKDESELSRIDTMALGVTRALARAMAKEACAEGDRHCYLEQFKRVTAEVDERTLNREQREERAE